jgi:hypothetical protein
MARTDDRRIVAELLNVPVESVELGPNLAEKGGFEEWEGGRPEWWIWSAMFSAEPFSEAAFTGGPDGLLPFEGHHSARVEGFWVQPIEGKSPARAGFWQWDEVYTGAVISVTSKRLDRCTARTRTITRRRYYPLSALSTAVGNGAPYWPKESVQKNQQTGWISLCPLLLL